MVKEEVEEEEAVGLRAEDCSEVVLGHPRREDLCMLHRDEQAIPYDTSFQLMTSADGRLSLTAAMHDLQYTTLLLLVLLLYIALPELDILRGADLGATTVVAGRDQAVEMLALLRRERGHARIQAARG